jgi:hypothetical protein
VRSYHRLILPKKLEGEGLLFFSSNGGFTGERTLFFLPKKCMSEESSTSYFSEQAKWRGVTFILKCRANGKEGTVFRPKKVSG